MPKPLAAYERLASLSSATEFDLWPDGLTRDNACEIIAGYDIVVDCCDNHSTRYLIDDVCRRLRKPGASGYTGIFPEREVLEALPPSSGGVVGAVPGVVGSMEAAEALKVLAGFGTTLSGKLFVMNIKTLDFNIIEL